jgi:hydrogenase maturation protease
MAEHPARDGATARARREVLVAGVGNVFLGDDGFGVEVVQRLARAGALPAGVRVADYGVRGFDLACALDGCPAVIVVDATRRGGAPGTLYVLDIADAAGAGEATTPDAHRMTLDAVLAWLRDDAHGGLPGARVPGVLRLVGCEPETFGPEGLGQLGLSATVAAAVDEAVALVAAMARELLAAQPTGDAPGA